MSDACCGDDPRDDERKRRGSHGGRPPGGSATATQPASLTGRPLRLTLPGSLAAGDGSTDAACDCCASPTGDPAPGGGPAVRASADLDDCCAPAPRAADDPLVHEEMMPWWRDRVLALPAASGVLLAGALLSGALGAPAVAVVVLELASLAAGAATFVPGALRRLARRRLGVGLLMTIAAVGAVVLGRYGEAAALAFLFSIAEALEHRAMDRAQKGLRALLALIPDRARVRRVDGDSTIPAADLREGDVLVVGAGDRVSTDGVVVEGSSSLDTAAVTGESIPVEVGEGDLAPAGSVNGAGMLLVRATADGGDNSLTQIVRLVEEAHARKGERARLADRIARPLVPAILLLAAAVAVFGVVLSDDPGTWIERALVVLVAASPCALAIAVPVTVISAIGSASRFGVIIKSGEAFEQLGTIRRVAFDKTGTLTRNQPEVVSLRAVDGWTESAVLSVAARLEATSTHPLADAVRRAAPAGSEQTEETGAAPGGRPPGWVARPAVDLAERAGLGVTGTVDGRPCRIGSPRWLDAGPLAPEVDTLADQGMSILVLEVDGSVVALIGVRDELRAEAAETVAVLARRGVTSTMLTGDNARTARALAHQVGIADVRAEQSPAHKAAAVEASVREAPTAMIGDGINDAPALAGATVGIAMGLTGSAAAVESADVAFTGTDLRLIARALQHAQRGRRIMTANIGLAIAIVVVLVPLAVTGVLGLTEVVLVHELAEVVVILNGVRAARVRDPARSDTGRLGTGRSSTGRSGTGRLDRPVEAGVQTPA